LIDAYGELATRIREELPDLERVVERAVGLWSEGLTADQKQDVYLDAVALNLHSFYSALERLLELIARHVDRSVPDNEAWHRELLQQMATDQPGIRPAVIGTETAERLDTFRRFRHLVRNVYTFNLQPEKMEELFLVLEPLWAQLQRELLAFASFLEALDGAS
jgi:hypothetical protein